MWVLISVVHLTMAVLPVAGHANNFQQNEYILEPVLLFIKTTGGEFWGNDEKWRD